MPIYEYMHLETPCEWGEEFEIRQSIKDDKLTTCPNCNGPVKRLISKTYAATPTSDTDLKSKGFTKLVRRDKGVYENVTASGKEERYFDANKPGSAPHLHKKIKD